MGFYFPHLSVVVTIFFVSHFQLNLLECQKSLRRVFTVVLSQEERRSLSSARTFSKEPKFFFRKILQVLHAWTSYTIKLYTRYYHNAPHGNDGIALHTFVALSPFRMQWHMTFSLHSMMNILLLLICPTYVECFAKYIFFLPVLIFLSRWEWLASWSRNWHGTFPSGKWKTWHYNI